MRSKIKKIIQSLSYNFFKHKDFLTPYERFEKEQILDSFNYFKKYFLQCVHFKNEIDIRSYAIKLSLKSFKNISKKNKNFLFLEFGVFKGGSINFFSKFLKNENLVIYGFDTFDGFTEDWKGTFRIAGDYSNDLKLPFVENNVQLIKGPIQTTLDKFFIEKKDNKVIFVHFDLDTFESTNFAIKKIKPFLNSESFLLFDNFYNYAAWKVGEFKALMQNFDESEISYLGFGSEEQVLIKISLASEK